MAGHSRRQCSSSPVADVNTHNIFVGDAAGNLRYVRDTGSTTGTCASGSPPCLGGTTIALGGSVTDGPLLDVSIPKVTWFDSIPGTGNIFAGSHLMNLVVQTDEALGTQRTVTFDNGGSSARTGGLCTREHSTTPTSLHPLRGSCMSVRSTTPVASSTPSTFHPFIG